MHKNVVAQIRKATRRKYSAEEKIRIVLEGLRGEIPISELCRREGIAPSTYYRWRQRFRSCGVQGLHDRIPFRDRNWNQLLPEERAKVLNVALLYPEWSRRGVRTRGGRRTPRTCW